MGFLDDFKDAMERGKVAADNYIERERAKEAEMSLPTHPDNKAAQMTKHPDDPSSPFAMTVKNEEPITVTDPATGKEVKFNILANGRAQLRDPHSYEGQDYKEIAKSAVLETVTSLLRNPVFLPNATDVKTLMMLSNKLVGPVTEALNTKGFNVAFKMLNVTPAREQ